MQVREILKLWQRAQAANEEAVLGTVVRTRGSSYRLPGARVLFTRGGEKAGSISGGCLEEDLTKRAWWFTENGPVIRSYDTNPDSDTGVGFGLGCNGQIDVLLERLQPKQANILDIIEQVRSERIPRTVTHSIDAHDVFEETLLPPVRLHVFGAGDDAIPLVRMAKLLEWEVWVTDGRSHYLRAHKFAEADRLVKREPADAVPVDAWTVAVVMTHSYTQDLDILKVLAATPPAYVGMLGPRKRSVQLLKDAAIDESTLFPALHSPTGLDIGADGPEQVALSVLAEIQSVLNGRHGAPLRERAGSIHAPDENDARAWVRSIACA